MQVRATERGYWPHRIERQAGEVFDYDGPREKLRPVKDNQGYPIRWEWEPYLPRWMEPVSE